MHKNKKEKLFLYYVVNYFLNSRHVLNTFQVKAIWKSEFYLDYWSNTLKKIQIYVCILKSVYLRSAIWNNFPLFSKETGKPSRIGRPGRQRQVTLRSVAWANTPFYFNLR